MNLSLEYVNNSDKIKSQISAGVIGLKCKINNHPFDLNQATDHIINIKLSNAYEYITNIRVNVKYFNSKDLLNGIFNLPTSNNIIQALKPDIYYLELWVNTNHGQFIFPSENQLKLDLMSNNINGSDNISSIAADQMKSDAFAWNNLLDQKIKQIQNLLKDVNHVLSNPVLNRTSNKVPQQSQNNKHNV